jgi:hypothetical protein
MRRSVYITVALAALATGLPARATVQPIRVHCGGAQYKDTLGNIWAADEDFNEGSVSTLSSPTISGTTDPALFQTGRWNSNNATPLKYTFAVPNGLYHVNLYFAETAASLQQVGARVFNVKLNTVPTFSNLDIYAEAGANAALIKGSDVNVTGGSLVIEFDNVVQNAKIDSIEVLPGASGPAVSLNFTYPDGTAVSGTLNYTVTSSLLSFKGDQSLSHGGAQVVLFANPSALGISAQFQVTLSLTDTAAHTLWQMTLVMDPSQVNLGAVQSSTLNVIVQKM